MFKSFEEWCLDKDITEDKKKIPVVHHDVDTWLTSVDNLKRELKVLKDKLKEKAKEKGIEPKEKPEEKPTEEKPEEKDKREPEQEKEEEEENTDEKE